MHDGPVPERLFRRANVESAVQTKNSTPRHGHTRTPFGKRRFFSTRSPVRLARLLRTSDNNPPREFGFARAFKALVGRRLCSAHQGRTLLPIHAQHIAFSLVTVCPPQEVAHGITLRSVVRFRRSLSQLSECFGVLGSTKKTRAANSQRFVLNHRTDC